MASGEEPVPGSDDTAEGTNPIPQETKDFGWGHEVGEGESAPFAALLIPVLCGRLAFTGACCFFSGIPSSGCSVDWASKSL